MPRPRRIDFPGARHHVMNRGARKQLIFLDDDCCALFLDLVGDMVERFKVVVHGYCLMPNHYHLMVQSIHGNLSTAMAFLGSQYTAQINHRMGWDGSVFRGRFRNRVVRSSKHWLHLLPYLHLNPVEGRLVSDPDLARWTSHGVYTGVNRYPGWVTTSELLQEFGGVDGYERYLREVMIGRREAPDVFEQVAFTTRRTASELVERVEPEPLASLSVDDALSQVLQVCGVTIDELRETKPGRKGNPARVFAAWWLVHGANLSNVETARLLGMGRSSVTRAISRVRGCIVSGRDPIYVWVTGLEDLNSSGKNSGG